MDFQRLLAVPGEMGKMQMLASATHGIQWLPDRDFPQRPKKCTQTDRVGWPPPEEP